jgi:3-methyladenine DNA glycosylase AlkC
MVNIDILEEIRNRKGPKNLTSVNLTAIKLVNDARIETANLMEWIACDLSSIFKSFIQNELPNLNFADFEDTLEQQAEIKHLKSSKLLARRINDVLLSESDFQLFLEKARSHTSDIVREWAALAVGYRKTWSDDLAFLNIHTFADDSNFGVKELAWMAMRERVIANLEPCISILKPWSLHPSDNIRRFASELTRPNGVWCNHILALKKEPWQAIEILEPLYSDSSLYVRNSVANWLNDASKSHPNWAKEICEAWKKQSNSKETAYIIKRALRTINKADT